MKSLGVYLALMLVLVVTASACAASGPDSRSPFYRAEEVFPLVEQHVHGSSIVELPNGDLLTCWFEGSGERWADDVAIMGARKLVGNNEWSAPFVLADVPGFPDINPTLFIDTQGRLWLLWYTVMANLWESSLPKYRLSYDYMMPEGPPVWAWQDALHVKVGDPFERGISPEDSFVRSLKEKFEDQIKSHPVPPGYTDEQATAAMQAYADEMLKRASGQSLALKEGYPSFRRLGWQTQNKPVIVDRQRLIVPLYSDGFSISVMAITDDWGKTWSFSEPIVGLGNIQPTIARRADGTLVTYMRDNGVPPKRLHISQSSDNGMTWSPVRDSELANPGSGADIVTLSNGHWLLVYNDSESGRHSLAVSISVDEGKTWPWTRHLELDSRGDQATRSHYPAVVEAKDGSFHVVYSFHHEDREGPRKTIKHVHFNEAWVQEGDN